MSSRRENLDSLLQEVQEDIDELSRVFSDPLDVEDISSEFDTQDPQHELVDAGDMVELSPRALAAVVRPHASLPTQYDVTLPAGTLSNCLEIMIAQSTIWMQLALFGESGINVPDPATQEQQSSLTLQKLKEIESRSHLIDVSCQTEDATPPSNPQPTTPPQNKQPPLPKRALHPEQRNGKPVTRTSRTELIDPVSPQILSGAPSPFKTDGAVAAVLPIEFKKSASSSSSSRRVPPQRKSVSDKKSTLPPRSRRSAQESRAIPTDMRPTSRKGGSQSRGSLRQASNEILLRFLNNPHEQLGELGKHGSGHTGVVFTPHPAGAGSSHTSHARARHVAT